MRYLVASALLLAGLLLTTGCHTPRETRSVHLPLTVGNRWVYDVTTDSGQRTAKLEVVENGKRGYGLSVSGERGHLSEPDTMLFLRSRDTVLWLLSAFEDSGRTWWASLLSDDPGDSCTSTLLLYRPHSGTTTFSSRPVGAVVVGDDTFPDCLRLSCQQVRREYALIWSGSETTWVSEDYAPGVGMVRLEVERHWSSWGWFIDFFSNSGSWFDRWDLREYSVAD
jgi:hypothetical protein